LQERLQNNDDIPRKIIKIRANLVNTDPYWMNRRQELQAVTFYRRKENTDLPDTDLPEYIFTLWQNFTGHH